LIALYLSKSPCRETFESLRHELDNMRLLPKRLDWEGQEHSFSYQEMVSCLDVIFFLLSFSFGFLSFFLSFPFSLLLSLFNGAFLCSHT